MNNRIRRTTHILLLLAITILTACGGGSDKKSWQENADISILDSTMRHLAVDLYTETDSVSARCAAIMQSLRSDPDPLQEAYTTTVMAMISLVRGDFQSHDSLMAAARPEADSETAVPLFREFFYRTLGVSANLTGDNDEAYDQTLIALNTARKAGLHLLAIEDEAALGDFCQARGMMPEAATHMRRAMALADSTNYRGQRSLLLSLAEVYSSMGNYVEADRYFELHNTSKREYPPYTQFFYYSTLGNSMYFRGEYIKAADSFRSALRIALDTGDPFLSAMTKINLGETLDRKSTRLNSSHT